MGKPMTLRDFSAAIGISQGTISKALGTPGKYRISPERIAYIRAKAEELGFRTAKELNGGSNQEKRIGIVCGPSLSHLGVYFLDGAQEAAPAIRAEIYHQQCDNSIKAETDALRLMLRENMDAVIYWPGMQASTGFRTRLEKLQREAGRQIPVIYIHEEARPDILLINYNEEANARAAARRQLELGCRKFAVLRYYQYWGIDERATAAYYDELRKHGIPHRRIRTFSHSPYTSKSSDFAAIREVQGVWAEQCQVLLTLAPTLARYTDLKTLHVDSMEYIEAFEALNMICNPFCRQEKQTLDLAWLYGSSGIKFCSLRTLGKLAVEFAGKHIGNTDPLLPRQVELPWLTPEEVNNWHVKI